MSDNDKHVSLKDRGIATLFSPFTDSVAEKVVTWILEANMQPKTEYDHLTLIINSPGGEVSAAWSIIDCMKGSKLPVHTIGLGEISSCGLLTFIAGEKGHRTLTPNTSILSHQFSWGSWGKEHELFARVREFDLTAKRMLRHYQRCTGLTEAQIREKLLPPQDVWLSAEEAVALGVADIVKDMNS